MFCQKCGAELTPGAVYCIKCGNKAPIIVNQTIDANANEIFLNAQEKTTGSESVPDTLTGAVIDFQNGDQGAFDTIYNESKRYVYYTILKTTGDKEVADDILQETYLDVYKSLNQLQSPGAFKGWAAKIAQHKISRYYQKKSPELFSTEGEMDDAVGELTEDDMSALPEDAMINKEVQRLISEIIDELPENQKSTIVSFYYNQMSIPEIAETMGVPENTVKTYLFRGKKKIKDGILDIEKKHGTKLYALPLAGLLGLLFTEEAKAAVVTTTASQVLGTAASAAGNFISTTSSVAASEVKINKVSSSVKTVGGTSGRKQMAQSFERMAETTVHRAAKEATVVSVRTMLAGVIAGITVGASVSGTVVYRIYEDKIYEQEEGYINDKKDSFRTKQYVGEYIGESGAVLILKEDGICHYEGAWDLVGGGGTWEVVDGKIIVYPDTLYYAIYADVNNSDKGFMFRSDSKNWSDEFFYKQKE